ncbi:unknown protein (plasmid) [Synechocystis sp. PCC 6803]|uniref:Uncharacterized protein n=1 Tax=Synechocystis sp. (strain ATCC 27184 / PCC 6803 / Kazusa) TaxID=1111708 RepID=Q6ZEX9_SYNY3|nr:hypothetical protein MYO_220 [Synechocystis sp. PCC 6803]AVP91557.1 hypothetical protein C7I86_17445 [Synechocystis sp. IPPAS B-1465]MCW5241978.1 hypothetical protein [Synechocystis sp. PCC 6803]BAD01771.1 unknown protein [Synechocystis sp. PCC 6803]
MNTVTAVRDKCLRYFPTEKTGIWVEYKTDANLRDTENIFLNNEICRYFLREVKPHVNNA